MLTIRRETDYACRVILHLAMLPDGARVTAQEIAKRRIIPRALVRRVITNLATFGLVTTSRGRLGGIVLARPPSEISLLNVVEAMEGAVALNACTVDPKACPLMQKCSVHEAWCHAHTVLVEELSRVTFDALSKRGSTLGA